MQASSFLVSKAENVYMLTGEIFIHQISALAEEAAKLFKKSSPKVIDLAELIKADSALLALLIEWKSQYKEQLCIKNMPHFLRELMKIYQIDFLD